MRVATPSFDVAARAIAWAAVVAGCIGLPTPEGGADGVVGPDMAICSQLSVVKRI